MSELESNSKVIPTLNGTDSFIKWRRAITAYLLDKGALRSLEGREAEPFRRSVNLQIAGDDLIVRPVGEYAGAEMPSPRQTTSGNALTAGQKAQWEEWEKKERKARATILLSISPGVAAEVENLWSAHDMFNHIKAEHRVDTVEHRGNLHWRIQSLRLPSNASADQLDLHYESFNKLVSDIASTGAPLQDWDKCERFLISLDDDLDAVRLQFRLMPNTDRTWPNLVTAYKSFGDTRRMRQQRDGSINAIYSKPPAAKLPHPKGKSPPVYEDKGRKPKNKGKKGDVKGSGKPKCDWCGIPGHLESECRKKSSGEPSRADIMEAARQLRDKRGQVNRVDAQSWTAGENIFGSVNHIFAVSNETSDFLVDSGATHHLVNDRSLLSNIESISPITFMLAGSGSLLGNAKGDIIIPVGKSSTPIKDVYHVPDVRMSILSMRKLQAQGWIVDFGKDSLSIKDTIFPINSAGPPIVHLPRNSSITPPLGSNAFAIRHLDSPLFLEHCRLGHLSRDRLIELAKGGTLRYDLVTIKDDEFKLSDCLTCLAATSRRLPNKGESPRGTSEGEIIHIDLTGRVKPSIDGAEYGLIMYADHTKVWAAIPIKLKSDAAAHVQSFVARIEKQANIKVKAIRSDQGSEFSIKAYCERTGIIHQTTPGYAPYLNGVAERAVGTVKTKAAILVLSTPLGHPFWSYAMKYAAVILNKTTMSGIDGKTAWQVITGRETNLDSVREFGEICFAHVPPELRAKSNFENAKGRQARILGQDEAVTGYIVRYEDNGSIGHSRDVRTATGVPLDTRVGSIPTTSHHRIEVTKHPLPPPPTITVTPPQPASTESQLPAETYFEKERTSAIGEQASHVSEGDVLVEKVITGEGLRIPVTPARRSLRLSSAVTSDHGLDARSAYLASESALVFAITPSANEPKSLAEALRRPDAPAWSAAVRAELDNLIGKETWEEATLPAGRKAIGCKWVLKTKTDADGNIVKHKARLVAQGFSQQPGIDFEETFAPVGRSTSLRILLTIAAAHDLEVHQADVEGAYLNAKLDREIYMRVPQGYHTAGKATNVLRLKKTLYGLKQSGREWWKVLGDALHELGFDRCETEWGMYVSKDKSGTKALLLAYVDDIVIAAKTTSEIDRILDGLAAKWTISKLGPISHILGSKVSRDRTSHKLWVSQTAYIDSLMERFPGYSSITARYSPLPNKKLDEDDFETPAVLSTYQELVGCLLWLAGCTRPDVSYAASYLSRFTASPTETHWGLALRVVSYLANTRRFGLALGGTRFQSLEMYVDADWAGCEKTRRSTTGYMAILYGSPINWCSRRQQTTAASTMEAEYIAGAEATKDVIWLRNFLDEIGLTQKCPTTLFIDNQAAIRLAGNPSTHARSKHIDIKHHIIRERVEIGDIVLEYVETGKQRADVFTKPLGGPQHAVAVKSMRLEKLENRDGDDMDQGALVKGSVES